MIQMPTTKGMRTSSSTDWVACKKKIEPNNVINKIANSMIYRLRCSLSGVSRTTNLISSCKPAVKSIPYYVTSKCEKITAMITPQIANPIPWIIEIDNDASIVSTTKAKLGMLTTHNVESAKPLSRAVPLKF